MAARTYNWLLNRLSEEYARVQFFRLYEYVRLYELDREMRSHETYDFTTETKKVNRKHDGDNDENILHAKLVKMVQDSLSLLNAATATTAAPRADERRGISSRNKTFVRLLDRVADILLCI